jgi:hypothetical protein
MSLQKYSVLQGLEVQNVSGNKAAIYAGNDADLTTLYGLGTGVVDVGSLFLSNDGKAYIKVSDLGVSQAGDWKVQSDESHLSEVALLAADNTFTGTVNTFSNDVTINGDLQVAGNVTTVGSVDLVVSDNKIMINDGNTDINGIVAGSAGIEIDRGVLNNVCFIFDETTDKWQLVEIDGVSVGVNAVTNIVTEASLATTTEITAIVADIGTLVNGDITNGVNIGADLDLLDTVAYANEQLLGTLATDGTYTSGATVGLDIDAIDAQLEALDTLNGGALVNGTYTAGVSVSADIDLLDTALEATDTLIGTLATDGTYTAGTSVALDIDAIDAQLEALDTANGTLIDGTYTAGVTVGADIDLLDTALEATDTLIGTLITTGTYTAGSTVSADLDLLDTQLEAIDTLVGTLATDGTYTAGTSIALDIDALDAQFEANDTLLGTLVAGNYTAGTEFASDIDALDTQVKLNEDAISAIDGALTYTSDAVATSAVVVLDTVAIADADLVKWEIMGSDDVTDTVRRSVEVTALHDDVTAQYTQTTILSTGLPFFSASVAVSGSNLELSITAPSTGNATSYKAKRIVSL